MCPCISSLSTWGRSGAFLFCPLCCLKSWQEGKKRSSHIHPMGPKSCWLSSSLLFIYTSYAAGHDLNLNRICWLPFISTVSGFSSSKLEGICLRKEENPIKKALQKMNLTSQILNLNINLSKGMCLVGFLCSRSDCNVLLGFFKRKSTSAFIIPSFKSNLLYSAKSQI